MALLRLPHRGGSRQQQTTAILLPCAVPGVWDVVEHAAQPFLLFLCS